MVVQNHQKIRFLKRLVPWERVLASRRLTMRPRCLSALLLASAAVLIGLALSASTTNGGGKSNKATAEDIAKQWSFTPVDLNANGKVSGASQSNGEKLKWGQVTVQLVDLSYAEAFSRVVKFYADKFGYNFEYRPKQMVVGAKGENKHGRFIFSDVRGHEPRESSFVYNTPEYTVSGFVRPALEKDAVEVTLTIAVR
jgi:hypothetical protein